MLDGTPHSFMLHRSLYLFFMRRNDKVQCPLLTSSGTHMSKKSFLEQLTAPDERVRSEGLESLRQLTDGEGGVAADVMAALANRRTTRTLDLVMEMEVVALLHLDDAVKYSDYIVSKLRHDSTEVRCAAMRAITELIHQLREEERAISFMYTTSLDTLVSFTPSEDNTEEVTLHKYMMSALLKSAKMVLAVEGKQAAIEAARDARVAKAKIAALGAAREVANAAVGSAAEMEKRAAARRAYDEAIRATNASRAASARAAEVMKAEGAQTDFESDYLVSMLKYTDLREGALRALLEIQKVRGSLDFRFSKSIDALDAFKSENDAERKVYSQLRAALDMPRRRQALHFVNKARLAPPR